METTRKSFIKVFSLLISVLNGLLYPLLLFRTISHVVHMYDNIYLNVLPSLSLR